MLRPFAHPVACCWRLLRVAAQSLKPVKLFSQQLPTFLLFRDRRSVAQQCWIRLHGSSNIVGATHAHYAWITKTYGLYSTHDALQVPNLLGVVAPFACSQKYNCSQEHLDIFMLSKWKYAFIGPFATSHSRGPKPPFWRARDALGQEKQGAYIIKNGTLFCLSSPGSSFALQHTEIISSSNLPVMK